MNYFTALQYNDVIKKRGAQAFTTLSNIEFSPVRKIPVPIYLYGTGANAVVFKGERKGRTVAIRCFLNLNAKRIERYSKICSHLKMISPGWKVSTNLLQNEIEVNNRKLPVLTMDWVEGKPINEFVAKHLHQNNVLSDLQTKLVTLSTELEECNVGHGDIQCGNMLIVGDSLDFKIKLIDYDGMYVPSLTGEPAIEVGRSEFQHPKRDTSNFNDRIDRFPIWVMIIALEALKIDKSLWIQIMDGGHNTLDNLLFQQSDFLKPDSSKLFQKIYNLNSEVLIGYLDKLNEFIRGEPDDVPRPFRNNIVTENKEVTPKILDDHFHIVSNSEAAVLKSDLQTIGITPLSIPKKEYEGKTVLVANGRETKRIVLTGDKSLIDIVF